MLPHVPQGTWESSLSRCNSKTSRPSFEISRIRATPPGIQPNRGLMRHSAHTKLLLGICLWFAAAQLPAAQLPPVNAHTLAGQSISLPAALHNQPAILILSTTRKAGDASLRMDNLLGSDAGITLPRYNLMLFASLPGLLRRPILGTISRSLPAESRTRFIPLFDHEREWKSLASCPLEPQATLLLLAANGEPVAQLCITGSQADLAQLHTLLTTHQNELR